MVHILLILQKKPNLKKTNAKLFEISKVLPKSILIMRFDGWNTTDGRFDMLKEFNFTATVGTSGNKEQNIASQKAYLDMGCYRVANWPYDTYGADALSDNPSQEVIQAWDSYVKGGLDGQEAYGIFNPTAWLCRQSRACAGLVMALKKHNVKMCSGYMPDLSTTPYLQENFKFVNATEGLYPSTYNRVVDKLKIAIENNEGFCTLTHGIYPTEEEANKNFGITEEKLREFFNVVKGYVDSGKLLVSNYREVYRLYNPIDAEKNDYCRLVKMITN